MNVKDPMKKTKAARRRPRKGCNGGKSASHIDEYRNPKTRTEKLSSDSTETAGGPESATTHYSMHAPIAKRARAYSEPAAPRTGSVEAKQENKKLAGEQTSAHESEIVLDISEPDPESDDSPDSDDSPESKQEPPEGSDSPDPGDTEQDYPNDSSLLTDTVGYSAAEPSDTPVEEDLSKSGVVFCSRIPPFMSLSKLRSYFSRYGKIGRIYAEPEKLNDYKRRVKMGGNKKLKFIHGWIEFLDKKVAKSVAAVCNGKPVGDKKRHNFWRDDLWNLLYLPRYKFNDIMAYLHENKQDRKEKLSFHLANSRKENYNYMEQLEAEKRYKAIEERNRQKGLPAFQHKAHIHKKEKKTKDKEDSETAVPMDLLGAIIT